MESIAISIIAMGFLFVFFSVPAFGIDILLDPVGFLLIWNGMRALKKAAGDFELATKSSFTLVLITSVQLFATGTILQIMIVLRCAAMLLLLVGMYTGFNTHLLRKDTPINILLFRLIFIGVGIVTLVQSVLVFLDSSSTCAQVINGPVAFLSSAIFILLIKFSRFNKLV